MNKDRHESCFRGFTQASRAWYAKSELDRSATEELMIGYYHPDGGTTGEFAIRWSTSNGTFNRPTARLEAFDDSWSALYGFADVLEAMAKMEDPEPAEVVAALLECGVQDKTQERRCGRPLEYEQALVAVRAVFPKATVTYLGDLCICVGQSDWAYTLSCQDRTWHLVVGTAEQSIACCAEFKPLLQRLISAAASQVAAKAMATDSAD